VTTSPPTPSSPSVEQEYSSPITTFSWEKISSDFTYAISFSCSDFEGTGYYYVQSHKENHDTAKAVCALYDNALFPVVRTKCRVAALTTTFNFDFWTALTDNSYE
jgi:hypothetical protein